MFIATMIFFILPSYLLFAAWKQSVINSQEVPFPAWRFFIGRTDLFIAVLSTLLELAFFASYFYNGGDPHGMGPSPGLWKVLGPAAGWTLVVSVCLSFFGRGKSRFLIPSWAASLLFVAYAIFMLQRD
jgi:hypothetical protein